ncbi:MAG: cob(I)yrinic acid a,c-diamide adenosyltransferase [bacterium]|nr:cob(I)yrinic acid a,c-diamide adenosyltransferase [bacterium]
MSRIYTKTGDKGETSLLGKRVEKSCLEVMALGEIDELNASLGILIASFDGFEDVTERLTNVQHNLFVIGAQIAAVDMEIGKVPKLKDSDPMDLENWIDEMEGDLEPLHNFILPGGCVPASLSFFARAVCRRAERVFVSIVKSYPNIDKNIGQYLNRLSDTLFVLARWLNKEEDCQDVIWKK